MKTPKINWYGMNELADKKDTSQPETFAEVNPTVTPVAKPVPEYPATDLTADEVETVEIIEEKEIDEEDYIDA